MTNLRAQRGQKNTKHEDFLTNLRRLTLVHEMSGNEEVFRFQEGSVLYPLSHVPLALIQKPLHSSPASTVPK